MAVSLGEDSTGSLGTTLMASPECAPCILLKNVGTSEALRGTNVPHLAGRVCQQRRQPVEQGTFDLSALGSQSGPLGAPRPPARSVIQPQPRLQAPLQDSLRDWSVQEQLSSSCRPGARTHLFGLWDTTSNTPEPHIQTTPSTWPHLTPSLFPRHPRTSWSVGSPHSSSLLHTCLLLPEHSQSV